MVERERQGGGMEGDGWVEGWRVMDGGEGG